MKQSILLGTLLLSTTVANGATYEVRPATSRSCLARLGNHTPNFFEPYPLSESPCSLGQDFANQVIANDQSSSAQSDGPLPSQEFNDLDLGKSISDLLDDFFKDMTKAGEEDTLIAFLRVDAKKIKQIVLTQIDLDANKNGIKLSEEWQEYFHSVGELLIPSALADMNHGVCDDSARLGVANSLKDQLKWGYRETIGMVSLGKPEGHVFTVSNFKNITDFNDKHATDPNKSVKTLEDYSQILKGVVPANPKRAVTCCDAWLDYHGSVDDFVRTYRKKIIGQERREANREKANGRELNRRVLTPQLKKLKVTAIDYSIPSIRKNRDEDNPKFRCFIKNSLRWMLAVFDRIRNIEQIYDTSVEARRPQQGFSMC